MSNHEQARIAAALRLIETYAVMIEAQFVGGAISSLPLRIAAADLTKALNALEGGAA